MCTHIYNGHKIALGFCYSRLYSKMILAYWVCFHRWNSIDNEAQHIVEKYYSSFPESPGYSPSSKDFLL